MDETALTIFVYSMPVLLIILFVLSIILFVNRKKIIAKYNVGYISSLIFTACMLMPLAYILDSLSNGENTVSALIISLVYPLIGLIVFMIIYRKQPLRYRLGKFFAMLGIGICSAFIFVFKMLSFFHHFESSSPVSTSTGNLSSSETTQRKKAQKLYDPDGKYKGYINEYGEKYDENGKHQGYIDEYGRTYNHDGKYTGRIDEHGNKYDQDGKYCGRVDKDGKNYNKDGKYIGRSDVY